MPHPLFGPEVQQMLHENDDDGLKAFCESVHPATVAETLAEQFSVEEAWKVLQHTGIREQAAIFEYLPHDTQVAMVGGTGRERMAKLIEQMSHDDRVDLLRRLAPQVAEGLLRLVDEADRRDIATLVFLLSAFAGGLFGVTALLPYIAVLPLSVVVGFIVQGNFSNLTSGVLAVATPRHRGATIGLYSCIGFGAAFLGTLLFGVTLDQSAGRRTLPPGR